MKMCDGCKRGEKMTQALADLIALQLHDLHKADWVITPIVILPAQVVENGKKTEYWLKYEKNDHNEWLFREAL